MKTQMFYTLGTGLTFAGMLIMTIATALLLLSKSGKTEKARAGGAIIIGPILIVLGAGPGARG